MSEKDKVKLTHMSSKGGWGCKIGPEDLAQVLRHLPKATPDASLLVGLDTSDDAGVYQLNEEIALVQTLDFFTPIVDDPYMFGQIAAANSLSDVYAMGGTPITAMNIVGFPISKLDKQILAEILKGAAHKVEEAGATLVGGHSIDDNEPKFGLSVTGTVHPKKVKTNSGARAGDRLILTKPLGVGILTTAIKQDLLNENELNELMAVMAQLNKEAAKAMAEFDVHACTDVTGFGLLGHAAEMAKGSRVGMTVRRGQVPILEPARALAEKGIVPGGTKKNHQWLTDTVHFQSDVDEVDQLLLCDAITSGGLLISVAEKHASQLHEELVVSGLQSSIIGEVTEETPGKIEVTM